jgi:hypothetical protein
VKPIERIALVVVVLSTIIIVLDAVTAHAGGAWMCDLLWWLRR